ncbi:MAG: ArnT family glycosyltransferase [Candidatus Brachytrichaceae bacterium NZ_4S206]
MQDNKATVVIPIKPIGIKTKTSRKTIVYLLTGVTLILFAILLLWNQPYFPKTWIDEGFTAQGAMNLVRYGQYAMKSAEGFRVLDQPLIANGPGIQLPIAASFAVFGIGLWQMRIVVFAFAFGALIAFMIAGKKLYGTAAALIAATLLIALPYEGFLYYSRIAMGNVPGLFYFFAGLVLWLKLVETRRWHWAMGAGLLFGLSLITKGQYAFYLLPCLGVMTLADILYYRSVGLARLALVIVLALGVFAVWSFAQYRIVGPENYPVHVAAVRANAVITVLRFEISELPTRLGYLLSKGVSFLHLPALAYALWLARERSARGLAQAFVPTFVLFGFAWYLIASIGWARYAFEPYAVGFLAVGNLVVALALSLHRAWSSASQLDKSLDVSGVIGALTLTLIICAGAYGLGKRVVQVTDAPDRSAEAMAAYLVSHIDPNAVIATGEWELAIQANMNYLHPEDHWVNLATLHTHGSPQDMSAYAPLMHRPAYLIDGPFSKWAELYRDELENGCCELIFRAGLYDLYRVVEYQ